MVLRLPSANKSPQLELSDYNQGTYHSWDDTLPDYQYDAISNQHYFDTYNYNHHLWDHHPENPLSGFPLSGSNDSFNGGYSLFGPVHSNQSPFFDRSKILEPNFRREKTVGQNSSPRRTSNRRTRLVYREKKPIDIKVLPSTVGFYRSNYNNQDGTKNRALIEYLDLGLDSLVNLSVKLLRLSISADQQCDPLSTRKTFFILSHLEAVEEIHLSFQWIETNKRSSNRLRILTSSVGKSEDETYNSARALEVNAGNFFCIWAEASMKGVNERKETHYRLVSPRNVNLRISLNKQNCSVVPNKETESEVNLSDGWEEKLLKIGSKEMQTEIQPTENIEEHYDQQFSLTEANLCILYLYGLLFNDWKNKSKFDHPPIVAKALIKMNVYVKGVFRDLRNLFKTCIKDANSGKVEYHRIVYII